ncbi:MULTISPECIES: PAQR family membrane homeostasis protein TrhA [Roseivirga]|uniref:PAQR family membrane homeostasis protein TrhA n=1 Tax=Roseivirga TaxID=290180 RepID=UPI001B17A0EA|nr:MULTISPECIES: hemolysin III family protein [Roseivirga]MBO6661139.1 hemolysin III family protein [Roseivirga sp.]MBO6762223.1 hemolysin III family protein [Roseivirga sp.]MBO6908877.1 hemolysin III family protein [Roseivirga sp.]WPZ11776.1 hemolysin III family protein [Roseivirga spongicola]
MKKEVKLDIYTPEEELANAITHGIGILGALVAFIYVLLQPIENTAVFWSTSVFCATAFILYSSSTLYHSVKSKSKKFLFKKLDHISIYLLIAGTFTPFCWGVLGNTSLGINLLIAVWAIVIAGIVFKIFLTGKLEFISLASYLGMGWLGFLMFDEIAEILSQEVVNMMLYGGVSYTVGVAFYLMRKLKYHHAIWHLFVLGGTGFHMYAVLKYVVA